MNSPVTCQPTLRFNSDLSLHGPGSVSAYRLGPGLVNSLASCTAPVDLLKSIFRVTVAQAASPEGDSLPDVSGRYLFFEDEVQFIPHFPFETNVKYRATFDPRPLGVPLKTKALNLEFLIPTDQNAPALTEVTHIFPSCDVLPENLLRFYICFSNSMQRGRALEEISLLDSDGQPVADSLYRPPVELWDRTMQHLTVLLDPGRLKRGVGPNRELGSPLKAGQVYTLAVGAGMVDLSGRRLHETFYKHFRVTEAVREHIEVKQWEIVHPVTKSCQPLVLMFPRPLDWALLSHTITITSKGEQSIDGRIAIDQCERRWSFTPTSAWPAGPYHVGVASSLEDVCGNSVIAAFDAPLRSGRDLSYGATISSIAFDLV